MKNVRVKAFIPLTMFAHFEHSYKLAPKKLALEKFCWYNLQS